MNGVGGSFLTEGVDVGCIEEVVCPVGSSQFLHDEGNHVGGD